MSAVRSAQYDTAVRPLCRLARWPSHAMLAAALHSILADVRNDALRPSRSSRPCSSAVASARLCSGGLQTRLLPAAASIPGSTAQLLEPHPGTWMAVENAHVAQYADFQ